MKKNLLILLFLTTITLSSCIGQNLSKSIENSLGEKLYLKISGKLYLKQSSQNTILLLCRSTITSEENFDKAITIFSETSILKLDISETDEYEIQIPESKKFAVLYNITKNKIYFIGTSDKKNDITQIKQNSAISKAISESDYLGYGFSFMNGSWSTQKIKDSQFKQPFNTLDFANNQNTQLKTTPPIDDDDGVSCALGTCTSGGAGSSSCSITEAPFNQSCTVTCNSGYYACCVSSTVRCYCCKI